MRTNRFKQITKFVWLWTVAWMLSGCHSLQDTLFQLTREHASADTVRKAALPLFSKYTYIPRFQGDTVVPFNEVPEEIKALPLFSTIPKENFFILTTWAGTNNDALLFMAGSGFGHWGIVVCKNESDRQFEKAPSCTFWKQGIYFYNGH